MPRKEFKKQNFLPLDIFTSTSIASFDFVSSHCKSESIQVPKSEPKSVPKSEPKSVSKSKQLIHQQPVKPIRILKRVQPCNVQNKPTRILKPVQKPVEPFKPGQLIKSSPQSPISDPIPELILMIKEVIRCDKYIIRGLIKNKQRLSECVNVNDILKTDFIARIVILIYDLVSRILVRLLDSPRFTVVLALSLTSGTIDHVVIQNIVEALYLGLGLNELFPKFPGIEDSIFIQRIKSRIHCHVECRLVARYIIQKTIKPQPICTSDENIELECHMCKRKFITKQNHVPGMVQTGCFVKGIRYAYDPGKSQDIKRVNLKFRNFSGIRRNHNVYCIECKIAAPFCDCFHCKGGLAMCGSELPLLCDGIARLDNKEFYPNGPNGSRPRYCM